MKDGTARQVKQSNEVEEDNHVTQEQDTHLRDFHFHDFIIVYFKQNTQSTHPLITNSKHINHRLSFPQYYYLK